MALPPKYPLIVQLGVENKHAAQVRKILTMSANRLDKDIKKLGKGGNPITRMQAEAQRASIHAMLQQDFTDMHTAITQGKIAAAKAASTVVSNYENQLLKMVMSPQAMQNLAISEANRAAGGLDALMKRVGGTSHIPLSKQVYKTQQMTLGWVDARINQALVSGWSAAKLASEVKGMIDPNVKGGVSYAANRLARTEINNSFHASNAERYANSVIVEAVDWTLSSSHPEGDVCDDMVTDGPYKKTEVPQKPHPHCYCIITPALPTEDEFMKKLFAGDYDEGNTFVDEMKTDPAPTFNTLAKQYKINGDLLAGSGATPQQLQKYFNTLTPEYVTMIKNTKSPAVQQLYWDKAKKIDTIVAPKGPAVTFNTLAKQYKIKGSVLEGSGASPLQLQEFLGSLDAKNITALKKLPPNLQQIQWNKAAKVSPPPPPAVAPTSSTYASVAKKFGLDEKTMSDSPANLYQIEAYLDNMSPSTVKAISHYDDYEQADYWLEAFQTMPKGPVAATAPKFAPAVKTAKEAAAATAPKTAAAAKKAEAKAAGSSGDWLNKAAPAKPAPPAPPGPTPAILDAKAYKAWYATWHDKVAQRFADYAKASGNSKNDITKSLNYTHLKQVGDSKSVSSLKQLKDLHYIDDDLEDEAKRIFKLAEEGAPTAADAKKFKKALADHQLLMIRHEADLADWRAANGIVSNAKGMDGALVHKSNQEGMAWANKNLRIAPEGVQRNAAKKYSGSSYHAWNNDLRNAASHELPSGTYKTATKHLDDAMAPMSEDVILHRGTGWKEFELGSGRNHNIPPPPPTDLIGSVQTNHGYTSTSVGTTSAFSGSVSLRIRVPAGHNVTWIEPYSSHKGEREVLLSRSTSLYIHDVYQVPNSNRWIVDAEVVPIGEDATVWTPMPSSRRP